MRTESSSVPYAPVRRFSANSHGRDFVVGDVHGMTSLLMTALHQVSYDPHRDRIFSVGDLIDRGPESDLVDGVLSIPGLYAVKGNHECMLLDLVDAFGIDADEVPGIYQRNGLGWWAQTPIEKRCQIIDAIKELPLVIEVETVRGAVGIVHAGVPKGMRWGTFCQAVERGEERIIEHATWSRERVMSDDCDGVPGIGRVFVGHTPMMGGVQRMGNVYYIDTGAVFGAMRGTPGAGLTVANMLMSTGLLQAAGPCQGLLNLLDEEAPAGNPFGMYAVAPN